MKNLKFDIHNTPLSGTNLIEASAGTGKTYSLALIVLRMIIEKKFSIEKILVVTFTEAATAELKERVVAFLREAVSYWNGNDIENDDIKKIVEKAQKSNSKIEIFANLEDALYRGDEAEVYTIHGFCSRMLSDQAFETGEQFSTEMIKDQSLIVEEITADFWRRKIEPIKIKWILDYILKNLSIKDLDDLSKIVLNHPLIKIEGEFFNTDNIIKLWRETKDVWESSKTDVENLILNSIDVTKNISKKKKEFKAAPENITQSLKDNKIYSGGFEILCNSFIEASLKKNGIAPTHQFFEISEKLNSMLKSIPFALKYDYTEYLITEIDKRKKKLGVRSYDDLITRLYLAVTSTDINSQLLKNAINGRYSAVLVDEFQDTDYLQYQIFQTLFSNSIFFMIGDPKQSIYRFRGGDVFSYVSAAKEVTSKYTLEKNYRSSPKLVSAFNKLFDIENPFNNDDIEYVNIESGVNSKPITIDEKEVLPLVVWNFEKDVNKNLVNQTIISESIKLLTENTEIDVKDIRRRVEPGDIAVLVNTNMQAYELCEQFGNYGVKAVLAKSGNVFKSDAADALHLLLSSASDPSNSGFIRSLLLSRLYCKTIVEIEDIVHDGERWSKFLEKIRALGHLWEERGVSFALTSFLQENSILSSLAASNEERFLTDIRHLIELLHTEELSLGTGVHRLLDRYKKLLVSEDNDESEQRLESDEKAIQILTVHNSKGLQFPIVFLPYSWIGKVDKTTLHNNSDGNILELRTNRIDDAKSVAQSEQTAENLRLFYVGVTRAEQRLYIAHGNNSHNYPKFSPARKYLDSLLNSKIRDSNIEIIGIDNINFNISDYNYVDKKLFGKSIEFNGDTYDNWFVKSYSSLTSTSHSYKKVSAEIKDVTVDNEPKGIFAFPRGASAGTALHTIFELVDFRDSSKHRLVIDRVLKKDGFKDIPDDVISSVEKMVTDTLNKNLGGFSLKDIDRRDRLTEMQFYLKSKNIISRELKNILGERIGDISIDNMRGFLVGFIDLMFRVNGKYYILDWKSNHLGNSPDHYNQADLKAAMDEHNYHLQYYIYTVAVVQILKIQIPDFDYEKDFGGVRYIFLRGITNDNANSGVFSFMPEKTKIEKLIEMFEGKL